VTTFWERVIATLVGTVAGFLFSIALFYLTEKFKRERERTKVLKGLRRELTFNLRLLESWLRGIETARPQVAAGDQNIYLYLDYSRVLRIFVQQAASAGLLYDLLADEELVALDKALRTCDVPAEQDFMQKLQQWKDGTIDNAQMFRTLEFHKYMTEACRKAMESAAQKVGGLALPQGR
jgi:hypothetical protein